MTAPFLRIVAGTAFDGDNASIHAIPVPRDKRPRPEPTTETCKNHRLRLARRAVWWKASHLMDYWRARLDWHSALSWAQDRGVGDANSFASVDEQGRIALVEKWRVALVKLTLTPAPDASAIAWKRAQLRAENYRYTDVKPERIERAIAEDVAFLAAHPVRQSHRRPATSA